jgi:hypothetical protein
MSGALGHAAPATTRTEASALARERHQPLLSAGRAPETRETRRQAATRQEVLKRAFNERWQALPVPPRRDVGTKRLVMLTHDVMEGALSGLARPIAE